MISVLVPYRPDGGHRDRAWQWIRPQWEALDVELVVVSPHAGAHPGEFNHPAAINQAARFATGDIFVVADADTAFDPDWILRAAELVGEGQTWVLPRYYDKLSEKGTDGLLRGDPWPHEIEWRGDSVSWSGLGVLSRETFEAAGGYDERFEFWGADDVCFAAAVETLVGQHLRLEGSATHCWHPVAPEHTYAHERHLEQHELMQRYVDSWHDNVAMRGLVQWS